MGGEGKAAGKSKGGEEEGGERPPRRRGDGEEASVMAGVASSVGATFEGASETFNFFWGLVRSQVRGAPRLAASSAPCFAARADCLTRTVL